MTESRKNLKIAITGGIASGKSTVTGMLRKKGFPVIDADDIAKELTAYPHGPALPEIRTTFGEAVFEDNGEFSRSKMRNLIFSDPEAKKKLENILHPMISNHSQQRMEEFHKKGSPFVFYDAALIIESGRADQFDHIVLVSCTEENQTKRLMHRDNISENEAKKIIRSQFPLENKKPYASWILLNDSTLDELEHQLDEVIRELEKS